MEDDDAIMGPIHIKLCYFDRNSSRRVSINIEIPDPPSTSRLIINVRSAPFDFVIILDDWDIADDEDAGVEEENEDNVEIFSSNSDGAAPSPAPLDVEDDEVVEDEEIIQIFLCATTTLYE